MATAKKAQKSEVAIRAKDLRSSFERERWDEASRALQSVVEIAQHLQRVEVSLLAQSLKADIDSRVRHAGTALFHEVCDRYEDLMKRLDHLSWSART